MNASGILCLVSVPLALAGILFIQSRIGRGIIADLRAIETVTTRLPLAQVREVTTRAMKGVVGFVAESENWAERKFTYNIRNRNYHVVLRANFSEDADDPALICVEIGVKEFGFPTVFGIPRIGMNFRRAANLRRKVVTALTRADSSASVAVSQGSWE